MVLKNLNSKITLNDRYFVARKDVEMRDCFTVPRARLKNPQDHILLMDDIGSINNKHGKDPKYSISTFTG